MTDNNHKYMMEAIAADLAELLVKDFNMSVVESLDVLYNSVTYSKLFNPHTGLYFQSSKYVYSFLKNELTTGEIG